jgi:hypothetical protein
MNRIACRVCRGFRAQLQHLGLHGDVERHRRLVRDESSAQRETHGDHGALLHAAGELVGIFARSPLGIPEMDGAQQLDRRRLRLLPGRPAMDVRGLADLQVDAQHGIECAQGVLRDEGDAAAAQPAARRVGKVRDGLAGELDLAGGDPGAARHQAQERQRGHGLCCCRTRRSRRSRPATLPG